MRKTVIIDNNIITRGRFLKEVVHFLHDKRKIFAYETILECVDLDFKKINIPLNNDKDQQYLPSLRDLFIQEATGTLPLLLDHNICLSESLYLSKDGLDQASGFLQAKESILKSDKQTKRSFYKQAKKQGFSISKQNYLQVNGSISDTIFPQYIDYSRVIRFPRRYKLTYIHHKLTDKLLMGLALESTDQDYFKSMDDCLKKGQWTDIQIIAQGSLCDYLLTNDAGMAAKAIRIYAEINVSTKVRTPEMLFMGD